MRSTPSRTASQLILTGGEASDYNAPKPRMEIPVAAAKALLADKTVLSFESCLNLAAMRLWLKSFVNTTE